MFDLTLDNSGLPTSSIWYGDQEATSFDRHQLAAATKRKNEFIECFGYHVDKECRKRFDD
jgi:hypothetical protein